MVPPNQAVDCYEALKAKGLSTALVLFPGEQHGFRQVHPWSNEERIAVPNSHRSLRRPLHLPWRMALHARRCMRSKLRNGPLSLDLTISWARGPPGPPTSAVLAAASRRCCQFVMMPFPPVALADASTCNDTVSAA